MSYVDYVEKNNTVYNFTSKSVADRFDTTTAYAVGDIVYYEDKLYEFTSAHPAGAWNASHVVEVKVADEIADLKEALTDINGVLPTKADKSGVVASAEQLLSDVGTEDKVPYLFRATPYDSTRVDEEIVGVSVGWNQLANFTSIPSARNGITPSSDDGKSVTYNGTSESYVSSGWFGLSEATGLSGRVGHVFLFTSHAISGTIEGGRLAYSFNGYPTAIPVGNSAIFTLGETASHYSRISDDITNGAVCTNYKVAFNVFDLTAWFGSTIADYALSLETATAGSGVAFIKALLPGGYIPYSAPKMESVSGLSGHRFTGFNWWDEELELGYYASDGTPMPGSSNIRCKNYIPVLPNTTYYFKTAGQSFYACFYDGEKNFLSRVTRVNLVDQTYTTDAKARYLRFNMASTYGTTYKHDICINISNPSKNGTYEPYKATTYALDSDLTLRGILKMDADHRVYADGDVYGADGTVVRHYGIVDLGSLTWAHRSEIATGIFASNSISDYAFITNVPAVCARYTYLGTVSGVVTMANYDKAVAFYHGGQASDRTLYVRDTAFNNSADFKAAMSGVYLVYEKATATTETASPYASPQNCAVGGTEEYVYAEGGSGVLVGHNSRYQKNLKGELERVSVAVPDAPGQNGTYSLKATVTSSGVTYGWVAD